jgi:nucleoside-diphosphate-sugar epimerase
MAEFTVLGSAGFIGRNLTQHLRSLGNEVFTPGRGDDNLYRRPLGRLIYCAGVTGDFRRRPYDTVRSHVALLADILERADFNSLLYLSSTRVYSASSRASENFPVEVDPGDSGHLYNLSKLTGEALLVSSGRTGVKAARLSNVAGMDPASPAFLSQVIGDALAGHIRLRSDPSSVRDFIHIDDVVDLLPRISMEGREGTYNVASGVNIANRDIVSLLAKLTGCKVSVEPNAPERLLPVVDTRRIRSEFAFTPRNVLDALPALVEEYSKADKKGEIDRWT